MIMFSSVLAVNILTTPNHIKASSFRLVSNILMVHMPFFRFNKYDGLVPPFPSDGTDANYTEVFSQIF
jgi:hypothetical protein